MRFVILKVECPFCQFENKFKVDHPDPDRSNTYTLKVGYQAVWCDVEDGGCDNPFAINVQVMPSQETNRTTLIIQAEVFALVKTEPKPTLKAA